MSAQPKELGEVERLAEQRPRAALAAIDALDVRGQPAEIRAQAKALRAILLAARGSSRSMRDAEALVSAAQKQARGAQTALARVAHARGYLAYKRGDSLLMLTELNRAASLYPKGDRRRAHVFDTLGMYFAGAGDPERARAYYVRSVSAKERAGDEERAGLAVTFGNLGRLELARARYEDAEDWFRKDLAVLASLDVSPAIGAHVKNQLARALLGQGDDRIAEAERLLREALGEAPPGSVGEAWIRKDLTDALRLSRRHTEARRELRAARRLAESADYAEVRAHVDWLDGLLAIRSARRRASDRVAKARDLLRQAREAFARFRRHLELTHVALDEAELLADAGRREEALRVLLDVALPTAERHLFQERDPLALIETRIHELDPHALSKLRMRRMLGGIDPEELTGRLLGVRQRITVWTCDIRGFSQFCEETEDPMQVVAMLNRIFRAVGQEILDRGGRIDKYIGDNVLAFFTDPSAAAEVALSALTLVERLNTEREHLDERILEIGIGIATGEVVVGNVGFAGKLEHTIIGGPVNAACRLVGRADPREILVDAATREAIGGGYTTRRKGTGRMRLKGIGAVQVYRLTGRRPPRKKKA